MSLVLGVDPGIATFGWALVELSRRGEKLVEVGVVTTKPSDKRRRVRQSDDLARRAAELGAAVDALLARHSPRAVCAEAMSWPRNAGSAAKIGVGYGVLVAQVMVGRGLPLVQASPQEVRKALCGKASASKDEMRERVRDRLGCAAFDRAPILASLFEHAHDAAAVVVACLDSDVLRMARSR